MIFNSNLLTQNALCECDVYTCHVINFNFIYGVIIVFIQNFMCRLSFIILTPLAVRVRELVE